MVKDNQGKLADALREFFAEAQADGFGALPVSWHETVKKDHGRIEPRLENRSTNRRDMPKEWAAGQIDLALGAPLVADPLLCQQEVFRDDYAVMLMLQGNEGKIYPLPFSVPPVEIACYWHNSVDRDPASIWMREKIAECFLQKPLRPSRQ